MAEGRYIALEGAEGSGKSTHAKRLADDLGAVLTYEHGGTPIGARIREILADPSNVGLTDKAEALLIAADRAQHLAEVVLPALADGRHVVSDRSAWSSITYQGYGRGLPLELVREINDWAVGGRWPDLVLLLDVPDRYLKSRMRHRQLDRFEQAGAEFHERVRRGFRELATADPEHWVVVDGEGRVEDVTARLRRAVRDRLGL
jgi:dTMP kinase